MSEKEYGKINAINDINYLRWLLMNKDILAKSKELEKDRLNEIAGRLINYIDEIFVTRKQLKKARAEARRYKAKYLKTRDTIRESINLAVSGAKLTPWEPGQNRIVHKCEHADFDQDGCYCSKYNHIVSCCGNVDRCDKDKYENPAL